MAVLKNHVITHQDSDLLRKAPIQPMVAFEKKDRTKSVATRTVGTMIVQASTTARSTNNDAITIREIANFREADSDHIGFDSTFTLK